MELYNFTEIKMINTKLNSKRYFAVIPKVSKQSKKGFNGPTYKSFNTGSESKFSVMVPPHLV